MIDVSGLIQGGIIAAFVSAVASFLTYRVAMRQTAVQASQVVMTADEQRQQRVNESAELLRKNLLEETERQNDKIHALEGRIEDQQKHIEDQDKTIFQLRTRLARFEAEHGGASSTERRASNDPPPGGRDRRRPLR